MLRDSFIKRDVYMEGQVYINCEIKSLEASFIGFL